MKDAIVRWLLASGYAEEERGYGHVSADELADALLENFDIRFKEN